MLTREDDPIPRRVPCASMNARAMCARNSTAMPMLMMRFTVTTALSLSPVQDSTKGLLPSIHTRNPLSSLSASP